MAEDPIKVGTSAGSLTAVPAPTDIQYGLQDISASDAGRTQDANVTMHKNRIGQKRKYALTWANLSKEETAQVLQAFNPEYVWVRIPDPYTGEYSVKEYYVGDRSAVFRKIMLGGIIYKSVTFNIIER